MEETGRAPQIRSLDDLRATPLRETLVFLGRDRWEDLTGGAVFSPDPPPAGAFCLVCLPVAGGRLLCPLDRSGRSVELRPMVVARGLERWITWYGIAADRAARRLGRMVVDADGVVHLAGGHRAEAQERLRLYSLGGVCWLWGDGD